MPAPYKVAIALTIIVLSVGIMVSYFVGYKVAYDRSEGGMSQLLPSGIQTFYAEVKEITMNSITVEGLSLNEEQYRGVFQFDVWAETSIVWGTEVITLSDLEQGDIVAITLITSAGDITDIFKIQLLR